MTTSWPATGESRPSSTWTVTYSTSGPTAMARLEGSVQGVVVQMRTSSGRSAPWRSGSSRRRPTVTVLSWRSW